MTTYSTASAPAAETTPVAAPANHTPRITSIDVLRGLVMFTMIFVNDLAGVPQRSSRRGCAITTARAG